MPVQIGSQLGSHEILSALGKGGMGEVWRARDAKLGREVAIKTLPPEFARDTERLARFEREARLLASLNHPNVAAIYGLEESQGMRFLVLELVEGETLAEVIKSGPVPVAKALNLALQIATAVEAAYEKGVIHRDLKPANIKVTPDGKVKVLDFGLAKAFQSDAQDLSNSPTLSMAATAKGIIMGTAAYMAPEQARGMAVDGRADIWAIGCVLYEMLTGRQTFRGEMVSDILASVLARDPDFSLLDSKLHPRIQETLQRCLEKDPRRRWQAVGDLRLELDRIVASGLSTVSTAAAAAPATAGFRAVLPWALAAALLAAAGTWALKPEAAPEPRPLTRFEVPLPDNQAFRGTTRAVMALSPDGRHFAYNTTQGIALRPLDTLEARIIPGTEDAGIDIFFSPNGEWVGYYSTTAAEVRKISIAGGVPVSIARSATAPMGISWGADGMILYSKFDEGIVRVSSDGGTPELVFPVKPPAAAYAPRLLPDGKTMLFSMTSVEGPTRWDQAEILAKTIGSSDPPKMLLRGGSDAHYSPTGHLVYAVGSSLFAVAFDLEALQVQGGPVPLVQSVQRAASPATNSASANFGLSNGGMLVYLNAVAAPETSASTLGIVDRSGKLTRIDLPSATYRSPRVSPDGRQIAVESVADNGQGHIWVYDRAGNTAIRRLTQEGSNSRPIWTRDSKRIVYGSDREKKHGLFWQPADGSGLPERLTTADEGLQHFPESWSPDSKVLAFSSVRPPLGAASWALWTLPMDNPDRKPTLFYDIPAANEFGASFSPDGKWIAYASNNANESNPVFGIYIQPYPPTGVKYEISRNGGAWPVWNPAGGELFYRLGVGEGTARLKAVTINTNPAPNFTSDKELPIQGFLPTINFKEYDILPGGREFVMVFPPATAKPAVPVRPKFHIVMNWFEELKARVPVP